MKDKIICVVCGGNGSEREVSLNSAKAVYDTLILNGYAKARFVDVDFDNLEAILKYNPDICFNLLHGTVGEDGVLQRFLDANNIRYTGTRAEASELTFDKYRTKKVLEENDISTANYYIADKNKIDLSIMPCVVKPSREGSSVGITIVHDANELQAALDTAFTYDDEVIVERFIAGQEFTVSIVNGEAMPLIWIRPKSGFYDYKSKYTAGATEYVFDTGLSIGDEIMIQHIALEAYSILGCSGAARVDIIFDGEMPYVLEANTAPGMTATSLLPKACAKRGISFIQLIEMMIKDGLGR